MSRKELVARVPERQDAACAERRQAVARLRDRRSPPTRRARRAAPRRSRSPAPARAAKTRTGGLLSALFGGGADEEEDNNAGEEVAVASVAPQASSGKIAIVPPELANPADISGSIPEEDETPGTIIAALPARSVPLPGFAPRPQADVGPADVPFGVAEDAPFNYPEQPPVELADAKIPFPTWRPDAGENVDEAEDQSALAALSAPLPQARPSDDSVLLASLIENDAIAGDKSGRLALAPEPASPKIALARLGEGPVAQPGAGAVKTTSKADRAKVADTKPAPRPLVVAAQPSAARWALGDEPRLAYGGSTPQARNVMAAVPEQVYAAGFQRNAIVADAGRFTGKAVSFMPVARFQTN